MNPLMFEKRVPLVAKAIRVTYSSSRDLNVRTAGQPAVTSLPLEQTRTETLIAKETSDHD